MFVCVGLAGWFTFAVMPFVILGVVVIDCWFMVVFDRVSFALLIVLL